MTGLGAKGAHCASRKENTALNRLQSQRATFLSWHRISFSMLLEDPSSRRWGDSARVPGWTLHLKTWKASCFILHTMLQKETVIHWGRLQLLMCCHTGQRGSHVSSWCHECSLAHRSQMSIWIGTQPFSSPVTLPPQLLLLSCSPLLEQTSGI